MLVDMSMQTIEPGAVRSKNRDAIRDERAMELQVVFKLANIHGLYTDADHAWQNPWSTHILSPQKQWGDSVLCCKTEKVSDSPEQFLSIAVIYYAHRRGVSPVYCGLEIEHSFLSSILGIATA